VARIDGAVAANQGDRQVSGTAIKLSVCLITYNRARFLDRLLEDLFRTPPFGIPFEILICDNASSDNTPDVIASWQAKQPEIRTIRQKTNVGPEHNLASAYRLARGEFCIYLADDDRLIPEAVTEVVRYLEANPNVAVVHSPWELYDDNEKQTLRLLYQIPEERVFDKKAAVDLFNFVLRNNVYPETCVYRTSALHRLHTVPFDIYSPFLILAHTLDYGDVAFLQRPFYRQLMRGVVPKPEEHLGVQWIVSRRDSYAAGYEYLAQKAFRHFGIPHIPAEQVAALQKMVVAYSVGQLANAVRLLTLTRNYRGAYEFMVRQQANGVCDEEKAAERRDFLRERASVQSLIETFEGISILDEILLYNVGNAANVEELARELRPSLAIRALIPGEVGTVEHPDRKLALVRSEDDRARLIEIGFLPGLVMNEADLNRLFEL
jgi:glycosyltransferase involved in cell wall biosynthesis